MSNGMKCCFQAFVNAFVKFASENVYFSGQNNMLYQPEFADIEKLKELMTMMENPSLWRQIGTTTNSELALKMNENAQLVWVNDMAVVIHASSSLVPRRKAS